MSAVAVPLAGISGFEGIVIGAILSIPIAILAPLATPRVAQSLARSNEARAQIRRKALQEEHDRIKTYHDDSGALHAWLLGRILVTTLISAATGVFSGFFYAAASFSFLVEAGVEQQFVAFLGQLISVLGSAAIVGVLMSTYRTWDKVRHFDDYSSAVQSLLVELGDSLTAPHPGQG
jgi:hypothetical protein